MEPIKNSNELFNEIDKYMNDKREIDLERFLSDHEEISFFDDTEEVPKDFKFKTVYSRTESKTDIFLYLIKDYENFLTEINKSYKVIDRETGNIFEKYLTLKEAEELVYKFENEDKSNRVFFPNFYKISEM